jgi:carbamoyl-phosphate synthase large subunit
MNAGPTRILVTGANGDIADAAGRILRECWPDAALHGADAAGEWPGLVPFDRMHAVPLAREPSYLAALGELVTKEGFDLVIPMTEPELLRLCQPDAAVLRLPLLMNPAEVVETGCDKLRTARWLSEHGIGVPLTVSLVDATPDMLPVIVKPRFGYGSARVERVATAVQLAELKGTRTEPTVAQGFIPDSSGEYTCAILKTADTVRHITLRRTLLGGLTGQAEVIANPAIDAYLDAIADRLPQPSAVNVQLRLKDGEPLAFEINPRFSSTVMMRHRLGFQDLAWMVNYFLHGEIPPAWNPPVGARVFRLSREAVAPVG